MGDMIRPLALLPLVLVACRPDRTGTSPDSGPVSADSGVPGTVAWQRTLAPLSTTMTGPRGHRLARAIVHLHSSWSHDACDGQPLDDDGRPRTDCLADLRRGLCEAGIEHAFLSDHPAHFATSTWEEAPLAQPGDTRLPDDAGRVLEIPCDSGGVVRWYPGVEDELMPVALDRHVPGDAEQRDWQYNQSDAAAIEAFTEAGATVWLAHTEGRDPDLLASLVAQGLRGVEVFNLHAAFSPTIRADDLGLDPADWLAEIVPFTSDEGTGEPDLFVLGVLTPQIPSEERWDALQALAPDDRVIAATFGTDAHQNVMPVALRDGERGDSYRRMLRWASQWLWLEPGTEGDLDAAEQALSAGRFQVVFEVLGTPEGFDFHLEDAAGTIHEMGSVVDGDALPATLTVTCPTLWAGSPRGTTPPEITATVYRDGEPWQQGCGSFPVDTPGSYRVRIDIVPWHLDPFLGDDPEPWLHDYPWVYGNPIRVRAAR
ncbi:MAG: hypothetical protein D6798_11325 [Deltaproteobacteria bacterium]|nr:MAG: hypothetical protein D6798_11325 [Deltaproteobacteria bacterium]